MAPAEMRKIEREREREWLNREAHGVKVRAFRVKCWHTKECLYEEDLSRQSKLKG